MDAAHWFSYLLTMLTQPGHLQSRRVTLYIDVSLKAYLSENFDWWTQARILKGGSLTR